MQALKWNWLLQTDSYKLTHWKQYPPGTERVYSYLTSRGGMFPRVVFKGLQYYLKAYFEDVVFDMADVNEAAAFSKAHFGHDGYFNFDGWQRLYRKWGGALPLRIRAVPEGTLVGPSGNVLMTVENTDDEFPWLTNYAETLLLKVWYPTTVATLSWHLRQVIGRALIRTGDPSLLDFKLHDFGYRGVSSEETAAIGAAGHLLNFLGTDTIAGIRMAQQFYGMRNEMPGFSIPATEHSTITSWGELNEGDAFENLLDAYPSGGVACVSDSYDIHHAVEALWGTRLRDRVMERDGFLVIRPDSGDPVVVLEDIFNILQEKFGLDELATNRKGYRVLAPCVRVIQGDGVNYHTIQNMISLLTRKGWAMDNFAFGMGGALLQQLNRDTLRFAFKCSAVRVEGYWRPVNKSPKTDPTKASRGGRFALLPHDSKPGEFTTVERHDAEVPNDCLRTVFENGDVLIDDHFSVLRKRVSERDEYANDA